MTEAIILGRILGVIGGCAIITLSVWLIYSVIKYRKLYRKALTGRDLAIQECNKEIDK
ncbi:hypothetical protein [Bartonella krasnovii]|uniref:Phage protein n=1 Tax=Bartonella krasnovii TaxID=2267275 RepID=A0ABY3VTW0_9HYPH|nr:hypothetical protein [Bartonella krasnovii]UNF28814.1 hypothetical protein MNL13_06275 [Bartonella krasnovii]UNF35188.1 hypothetical protein MNL12_06275 [Bartonella krasnovii]UNF36810.1 hypothetical protein MNL11_06925 [Bartonella krasnovii]UNF38499.1 hypothetical protein MNL10_07125 [Bartonella krasnovii]UNF40221.1 hypothetical protein MNL09_07180 [Bartonella krasnovii]